MFLSVSRATTLFANFVLHQAADYDKRDCQYSSLLRLWLSFRLFAKGFLCDGQLFAKQAEIIVLPCKEVDGAITHRRVDPDGTVHIVKLLTDVPLRLSNKEATELVYRKIQADVDAIARWATREVEIIWQRRMRRLSLAQTGVVKHVMPATQRAKRTARLDRRRPNWESDTCATFEYHGFSASIDKQVRSLYPRPYEDIARNLFGLPTKGALIPHMALLVINHPELTAGFFHELKLYDEHD
ncbi:hypothetical protein M3I54_44205 [Paraburkholderia sp. CNPSo 3274]|uniref:hypothetical protein n=1 Tax=Paraburkholderia sp. CNPSo 3274 TaxID=2940932 RepID=UPI0020B690B7|nr:hypothetical protein [Paraburkholderia sp. CNPSo 3274]MCP3713732.1 hypothetical protein [Paraburkholderia sp. CNPSo 3274]